MSAGAGHVQVQDQQASGLALAHREVLRSVWEAGPLSRWQLHEITGLTPNRAGALAADLIEAGLLREGQPESSGMGRPRVPLELDGQKRHLVGLALGPGTVELARMNLKGQLLGRPIRQEDVPAADLVQAAAGLLQASQRGSTPLAVGLSVPGFVDRETRKILFSSVLPVGGTADLAPLDESASDAPLVLANDLHALAARWLLTHRTHQQQDVLLVYLDDGRLGAALLADGKPIRGCVSSANELGHMRFFTDAPRCYCGQVGCLERIVSSEFLAQQGGSQASLTQRAHRYQPQQDAALEMVIAYLACGIANVINFARPQRLVLVSALAGAEIFTNELLQRVREGTMAALRQRVALDLWDEPAAGSAHTAAWLAMAELLYGGWEANGMARVS